MFTDTLHCRLARPSDAPLISAGIAACYGDSYVDPAFLQPSWVAGALARGHLHYALAFEGQRLVGQIAVEDQSPADLAPGVERLGEHCRAVVQPSHRRRRLMERLSRKLFASPAVRERYSLLSGRSLTNHLFTQRYNRSAGFSPLGLLLGLWPASMRQAGIPAPGQAVSCLLVGLPLGRLQPRELTLRGADFEFARHVLESLGVPAERSSRREALSAGFGGGWRLCQTRHPLTGLEHWRFAEGGAEALPEAGAVELARSEGQRLIWADVPSEAPGAPALAAHLRALGFRQGGYLPLGGLAGKDVLRLQLRLERAPFDPQVPQLLPNARWIADAVLAEQGTEAELVPC